jgi:hypothetical protein
MNRTTALALLALTLAGCSSDAPSPSDQQGPPKDLMLVQVGGLVSSAASENRRAPQSLAEVAKFESTYPLGYAAVKSGDVVVIWGASVAAEGDVAAGRAGTNVIAYEKQTPTEGGLVLLENGNVKKMSADEFKAAPKAK